MTTEYEEWLRILGRAIDSINNLDTYQESFEMNLVRELEDDSEILGVFTPDWQKAQEHIAVVQEMALKKLDNLWKTEER